MNFAHRYAKKKPDAGTYFLGMLIGLFLGYIFLQMPGNNAEITREEATYLVGTLQECDANYQRGRIHSIGLTLSDMEKQFVHQVCASKTLADTLNAIPENTEMTLLVHPASHNILEIQVNGDVLLEFNRSQDLLANNAGGFGILGIGLIALAIFCGINYVILEIKLYRK
ncbi:MAG: hypothetical protein J6B95_05950 [Oscillospiraceae bacterium]|nr:hypothetical protein [Oscillospiraceae bacterium]